MKQSLSGPQKQYGLEKLKDYANKHNLTMEKAAEILSDTKGFRSFYEWVNADTFLNEMLEN